MIVHLLEAALRLVGLTLRIREGSGEPVDLAVLCSLYTPKALLDGVCVRPRLHTHTHTHTRSEGTLQAAWRSHGRMDTIKVEGTLQAAW